MMEPRRRHRARTLLAASMAASSLCSATWLRAEPIATRLALSEMATLRWEPGERVTSTVEGELDSPSQTTESDGSYGRLDGDLTLALGTGAELPTNGDPTRIGARVSGHYFWMAGIYASYARTVDATPSAQLLGFGADLRPAFLPRFIRNMEHGPAMLDLMLDSISLGVGAFFGDSGEPSVVGTRGLEASLGLGIPLLGRASGPWLEGRGVMRWPEGDDAAPAIWVALSYHQVILTPMTRKAADADVRF